MKRTGTRIRGILLALLLSLSMTPLAFGADEEPNYFDCVILLYSFDSTPSNVGWSAGVLVTAGDGSGDVWAVTDYAVTNGATQYIVVDPSDTEQRSTAQFLAGNAECGVAVFRLEGSLPDRTAPVMANLDGMAAGDMIAVAGIAEEADESLIFFSRSAYLQDLDSSSGYTFVNLSDGKYPLGELDIYSVGAVMTDVNETVGFYLGSHTALPCAYLIPGAETIGDYSTGGEGTTPPQDDGSSGGGQQDPTPETSNGSTLTTVPSASGVEELLNQAQSSRFRTRLLQAALIAAAVLAAAGILVFALVRSRKLRRAQPPVSNPNPIPHPDPDPQRRMGKTEYVGGGGQTGGPRWQVRPLNGTPGQPREIPIQGLTFGRSPACDVTFPPDTGGVSGTHCSLTVENGTLRLTDLGSSYGTLLEDGRTLTGASAQVEPGTRFYLGSSKIGFSIELL